MVLQTDTQIGDGKAVDDCGTNRPGNDVERNSCLSASASGKLPRGVSADAIICEPAPSMPDTRTLAPPSRRLIRRSMHLGTSAALGEDLTAADAMPAAAIDKLALDG